LLENCFGSLAPADAVEAIWKMQPPLVHVVDHIYGLIVAKQIDPISQRAGISLKHLIGRRQAEEPDVRPESISSIDLDVEAVGRGGW
jgi:hypothetical protein